MVCSTYFAFDNIEDAPIIEKNMKLMREYTNKRFTFYVLCGFDRENKYDSSFWKQDIIDVFKRITILNNYGCKSYLMRFNKYNDSPIKGIYIALASWVNQPSLHKTLTFREYCIRKGMTVSVYHLYKDNPNQYLKDGYNKGATWRYLDEFESLYPDVAKKYFDLKY